MTNQPAKIHETAIVETERIGTGTRVWAFVHILPGAVVGERCNIGDHCFIENRVQIGNEVVIKNSVSIWDGVTLEDRVFVGPDVVFTNYVRPRAKIFADPLLTLVKHGASIGANSTLLCGISVGEWAMIGAGSVVTRDVPAFGLVFGNPGKLKGWVCSCGETLSSWIGGKARCNCGLEYVREHESRISRL